ncbi:MAG: nucleotide exchange factor GrpE, partial [Cyclobacteriaceae bacterium]|nr:nucleotide exchange factor GrpE [Cyclobacteriaceae bacterium]
MAKDIDKEKAEHSEVSEQTEELKKEATTEEVSPTEDAEIKINGENTSEEAIEEDEIEKLKADVQEAKDKYLRLYSEFEN